MSQYYRTKPAEIDLGKVLLYGGIAFTLYAFAKGGFSEAIKAIFAEVGRGAANVPAGLIKGGAEGIYNASRAVVDPILGRDPNAPIFEAGEPTFDPFVARWIMDHPNGGNAAAFKDSTFEAFMAARDMTPGSGAQPDIGSWLFDKYPPGATVFPGGPVDVGGEGPDFG